MLLLPWFCIAAQAIEMDSLYSASIPVADQTEKARTLAVQRGFTQIIAKLTGSSQVAGSQVVSEAAQQSSRYLSGFSYQKIPGRTEAEPAQLALSVQYSAQDVDRFLRQHKLPIWPADRQPILLWVVVDDPVDGREFIHSDAHPEIYNGLLKTARERGQPLTLPLLDLSDRLTLRADDAWYFNEEQLQAAAQRYQAGHWLVIRLFKTSLGEWRGSSWLSSRDKTWTRNYSETDVAVFMEKVMEDTVDQFARQYVYIPALDDQRIELVFEGVNSYADYKQLSDHLEAMEIVTDWQLRMLDSQALYVWVSIEGEPTLFFDALNRNHRLQGLGEQGHYRWITRADRSR